MSKLKGFFGAIVNHVSGRAQSIYLGINVYCCVHGICIVGIFFF